MRPGGAGRGGGGLPLVHPRALGAVARRRGRPRRPSRFTPALHVADRPVGSDEQKPGLPVPRSGRRRRAPAPVRAHRARMPAPMRDRYARRQCPTATLRLLTGTKEIRSQTAATPAPSCSSRAPTIQPPATGISYLLLEHGSTSPCCARRRSSGITHHPQPISASTAPASGATASCTTTRARGVHGGDGHAGRRTHQLSPPAVGAAEPRCRHSACLRGAAPPVRRQIADGSRGSSSLWPRWPPRSTQHVCSRIEPPGASGAGCRTPAKARRRSCSPQRVAVETSAAAIQVLGGYG